MNENEQTQEIKGESIEDYADMFPQPNECYSTPHGTYFSYTAPKKKFVGIAARDIKQGETIAFSPTENTKDILVKGVHLKVS